MATLTKQEKAWLKKVQAVLDECPSKRLGFFTIGDPTVSIYDATKYEEVSEIMDRSSKDFCACVDMVEGASFNEALTFPNPVESTAG